MVSLLSTDPGLNCGIKNWPLLLSRMLKNVGHWVLLGQPVIMTLEQTVKEWGRFACGSSLSSAYEWTSSKVSLPILSTGNKFDSQKVMLTTWVFKIAFEPGVTENKIIKKTLRNSSISLLSGCFLEGMSCCHHTDPTTECIHTNTYIESLSYSLVANPHWSIALLCHAPIGWY